MLATAAFAGNLSNNVPRAKTILNEGEMTARSEAVLHNLLDQGVRAFKKAEVKSLPAATDTRMKSAPMRWELMDEAPAGVATDWSRDCLGWSSFFDYILSEPSYGYCQKMVTTDDGKVYLDLQVTTFPLDTWIEATKDADGNLSIAAGQPVYIEEYEGEEYLFCLLPIIPVIDEEGMITYTEYETFKLLYKDGKYESEKSDMVLAFCQWDETEGWIWTGYGDSDIVLSPVTDTFAELPAGVTTERWSVINADGGYFANVGIDGNKIYIGGIVSSNPDAYVSGTINEENSSVTIEGGQFLGKSLEFTWAYAFGGKIEIETDEWGDEIAVATITGPLTFSYDQRANRLVADNALIVCSNKSENMEEINAVSYIDEYAIVKQERNPEALPQKPTELAFYDYYEDYGENNLYFTLPEFDVEGTLLDTDNLYYRIYVDGDVFTFYNDEYPEVAEEGQDLMPCYFSNFYNIYTAGTAKGIYFYFNGAEEIGVQSVYMQPVEGGEPKEVCSEIATVATTGVKSILNNGNVKTSEYYDLLGRRVANPDNGIYIRRDVMTDGTAKAVKEAR